MGWSLGHIAIREPERLEAFLLAVGKALYLANGYEAKCQGVLRIARLESALRVGHDLEGAIAICDAMKANMLCATLRELQKLPPSMKDSDAEILERAKDARNFIAHEAAWVGPLFGVTRLALDAKFSALHDAVTSLAAGDNLISRWIYEIEERQPAPCAITIGYPRWIERWVFG